MAFYKCKMCGGELKVSDGNTVAECEFCGTTQTVPSAKDENLQGLFNRANVLRMKSEFDKAEQIYERIIQTESNQAEAYWGLILCKFGIEYVEDPTTFKRVPTCHRTSLDSIIADDDYTSALKYADVVQREIYESEAKEIDRLQKEILSLSQKEDPYDVFVCYKETDEAGKRTQDSVIANDIYYQLTQEGFKVFYAAITLEDKLGSDYEPCIFAALNSAKVMLSIGTKPEYFNAVWVKNEWSRFLKLMKKNSSKVLIPCYRDMDAYELPEEFARLQAQDMSKIGFINDIVRGIRKVLSSDNKEKDEKKETIVINTNNTNTAPLLQRVFMFLEDGNWNSADEYCEKVLDLEPKNAYAYLGKLMAELHIFTQSDLPKHNESFESMNNYQKAIKFADEELNRNLNDINDSIKERIRINKLEGAYNKAVGLKNSAVTTEEYKNAATIFDTISEWKDSAEQSKECYQKAEELRKEKLYELCKRIFTGEVAETEENWLAAQKGFESISGWKDSEELAIKCADGLRSFQKNQVYLMAITHAESKKETSLKRAIELLKGLEGWRDSVQLIERYEEEVKNVVAQAESSYNDGLRYMELGKRYEAENKYSEAYETYLAAQKGFFAAMNYQDGKANAEWCSNKLNKLRDISCPKIIFVITDSINPMRMADGTHYVYEIKENKNGKMYRIIVDAKKGTTTREMKLEPGNYTIDLYVYGYNTPIEMGKHSHKKTCKIQIAPFETWKVVSNRPGMFSGLQLSIKNSSLL